MRNRSNGGARGHPAAAAFVNGYVEAREDRAHFLGRHGAGEQELLQGWSVKTPQHDAKAPVDGHFVEHLRSARGERGPGHARLVPPEPFRDTGLEQLHDLTARSDVDVRRSASIDLLPKESPHRPSSRRAYAS